MLVFCPKTSCDGLNPMWLIKELFVGKAHESVIIIISCIISYFQQCISFALWTGWWSSFKFNVQLFLHINKGISNWTLIHFPWCYGWRTYFVNPSILWRFYRLGLSECRSNDTTLSSPPSLSAGGNRFSKKIAAWGISNFPLPEEMEWW